MSYINCLLYRIINLILIIFFIINKISSPSFWIQLGFRFYFVKNIGSKAKYLDLIDYWLIAFMPSLKIDNCLVLNHQAWESDFKINYGINKFSSKLKKVTKINSLCYGFFNYCLHKFFNKSVFLLSIRHK